MSKTNLSFTFKEMNFLKDALSFRIQDYEKNLNNPEISEDNRSDMENDLGLLRIMLKYIENP